MLQIWSLAGNFARVIHYISDSTSTCWFGAHKDRFWITCVYFLNDILLFSAAQHWSAFLLYHSSTSWECPASAVFCWYATCSFESNNVSPIFVPSFRITKILVQWWVLVTFSRDYSVNSDFVYIDWRLIFVILNYAVLFEIGFWLQQKSVLRNFDDGGSRFHSLTGIQNFEPRVCWTAILKPFWLYIFNRLFHICTWVRVLGAFWGDGTYINIVV